MTQSPEHRVECKARQHHLLFCQVVTPVRAIVIKCRGCGLVETVTCAELDAQWEEMEQELLQIGSKGLSNPVP